MDKNFSRKNCQHIWEGKNKNHRRCKKCGLNQLFKEIPAKCNTLQNYRLLIRMCDEQNWILRNTIIWHKPNHMPSSVKDRFTNSYEPVFMLVKKKRYWFDLDAVRKKVNYPEDVVRRIRQDKEAGVKLFQKGTDIARHAKTRSKEYLEHFRKKGSGGTYGYDAKYPYAIQPRKKPFVEVRDLPDVKEFSDWLNNWRKEQKITIDEIEFKMDSQAPHHWFNGESYPSVKDWRKFKKIYNPPKNYDKQFLDISLKLSEKVNNPLGKNPGDVWKISTQPFKGAHFATFPEKLITPMILSSCPKWICKKCGKARVRMSKSKTKRDDPSHYDQKQRGGNSSHKTIGWTDCGCNVGWQAGIVLDPFMGSGTVGMVAKKLGRNYIGIELNPKYVKMAKERIRGQARAMI